MNISKTVLTLCICALLASVATHADEYESEIKARQAFMQILAYNNGMLAAMVRGKVPYDAEQATIAARNVSLAASMNNGSMWPAGSDLDSHEGTVAKKEIWSTWPEAGNIFNELAMASTSLEAEAGKGVDALKAAMGPVGDACSSCHKKFRQKR